MCGLVCTTKRLTSKAWRSRCQALSRRTWQRPKIYKGGGSRRDRQTKRRSKRDEKNSLKEGKVPRARLSESHSSSTGIRPQVKKEESYTKRKYRESESQTFGFGTRMRGRKEGSAESQNFGAAFFLTEASGTKAGEEVRR